MRIESCSQSFGCKSYISDKAMQVMAKRMKSGEFVKQTEKFLTKTEEHPVGISIDTVGNSRRLKATCYSDIDDKVCVIYKENFFQALFSPKKLLKKVFRASSKIERIFEKNKK